MAQRSKYGNVKTAVDGIVFDSAKEAARYRELTLLEHAGQISGLRCQVPFDITVNGIRVARYYADFTYRDLQTAQLTVEDVKSPATRKNPTYRLKAKLVAAIHGVVIREV